MSNYSTALQTVAAFASAVAGVAAFWVARNAFSFQKNSLLKTAITEQIVKLLQQLSNLKLLAGQPVLGAADEEVIGLGQRIAEAKHSVLLLDAMVSKSARKEMKKVHDIVHRLHEDGIFPTWQIGQNALLNARLAEAIDALQRVYRTEMK
jgi:hypothetical protein